MSSPAKPLPIPPWALKKFPGEERDATEWLMTVAKEHVFGDVYAKALASNDKYVIRRMEANIKLWVLQRSKDLSSTWERAFLHQLEEAEKTGWYHELNGELDSITELLATIADAQEEGTSAYSDYAFLVETVVPLLKQAGAKLADVWGLTAATSKARAAVPAIRHVLNDEPNNEKISKKAQDQVLDIVKNVTDTKVTVDEFKQQAKEVRGQATKTPDPIPAVRYHLGKEKEIIFIEVPSRAHSRAIEMALEKTIVSGFHDSDPFGLLKTIQEMIENGKLTTG